jgi:hypothetical protein
MLQIYLQNIKFPINNNQQIATIVCKNHLPNTLIQSVYAKKQEIVAKIRPRPIFILNIVSRGIKWQYFGVIYDNYQ